MSIFLKESVESAKKLKNALKNGDLVIFATDTIYGLACDATNSLALENLYQLKRRQSDKPVSILLPNLKNIQKIALFGTKAQEIAGKYMPGAITLVLEMQKNGLLAPEISNNGKIGIRIPDADFILEILQDLSFPIAATSVNISGDEAAINSTQIQEFLSNYDKDKKVKIVVLGDLEHAIASTVIEVMGEQVKILRQGAIGLN